MNLYNIWVSLSEIRDKNIDLFHDIQIFIDGTFPVNKNTGTCKHILKLFFPIHAVFIVNKLIQLYEVHFGMPFKQYGNS